MTPDEDDFIEDYPDRYPEERDPPPRKKKPKPSRKQREIMRAMTPRGKYPQGIVIPNAPPGFHPNSPKGI